MEEISTIYDLVLIHMTNHIPEDGIIKTPESAGVMMIENGQQIKRHRDTVHFCINGEVEPNNNRSIKTRYAIVIPLSALKSEDHFIGGTEVDFYSKGDVHIPKGSYILCPENDENLAIIEEIGRNGGIQVSTFEGEVANGHANRLIQDLGYKKETVGDFRWANEKDMKLVNKLLSDLGYKMGTPHSFSKERYSELFLEGVELTANYVAMMKEKGVGIYPVPEGAIMPNRGGWDYDLLNSEELLLSEFYKKLEEVGLIIPDSVRQEVDHIKKGEISEQAREEYIEKLPEDKKDDYVSLGYEKLANEVFRQRIIGEVILSRVNESINGNPEISFDNLLELFDGTLYKYTSEERRKEFINSLGIELTETEKKILENSDLQNAYMQIRKIKDIPYSELSEEDKQKFAEFKNFYSSSLDGSFDGIYHLSSEMEVDRENIDWENIDWENIDSEFREYGSIYKRSEISFSQEEIDKFGSEVESINNDLGIVFKNKILFDSKTTTLTQFAQNLEEFMKEIGEIEHDSERSVEDLGRETLEEQKDTSGKMKMESILAEKMRQFILSREGAQK